MKTTDAAKDRELTLSLLDELLPNALMDDMGVRLWDGTCIPDAAPRKATLVLKHPGSLRSMLLPGTEVGLAEAAGFEVRDVENLREHYCLTLRHWVRRLEAHHDPALRYVDEPTYRVWRLYMSGSVQGFQVGRLNVFQSLLVRPSAAGESLQPLTREDWYSRQP